MITFHDWIFDEALFKQDALRFDLDRRTRERAGRALELLQRAWKLKRLEQAGNGIQITELKAQQAFNQLVFVDLLGFSDLMSDGASYSLLPEVSFTLPIDHERAARPRTDLAIGDFAPGNAEIAGVAELKSPDARLSSPQQGKQYRSQLTGRQLSAVDQAVEAMTASGCQWALVSNLKLICLVHKSNPDHALRFDLSTLDDDGLRGFYFAFGPGGFHSLDGHRPRLTLIQDRVRRLSI